MKIVLVTGASSGIGKATAETLIGRGYTVYAAARRVESMADLAARGGIPIALDVTNDEQVVAAVKQIGNDHGGVDLLINNAGFGLYSAVEDTPIDEARYQFEVNLFGMARLTQLVLPRMRAQRAGTIVNISSMGGKMYTPLGAWYHATKHAVEGWSDCLRYEVARFGINVIIVEPGIIRTSFEDAMITPMLHRSGQGVYGKLANSVATNTRTTYSARSASPPSLIAEVIAGALAAKRPKTRYVAGHLARTLILARTLLGDRLFDRLLASQY